MSNDFELQFNTLTDCIKCIDPWIKESMKLEESLCIHIEKVRNCKTGVFNRLKPLKDELKSYFELETEQSTIRKNARALQKYIILNMMPGENEVSALLDLVQDSDKKLDIYFRLINAQRNEILSSRLTTANIILSIAAVAIALITVFLTC